MPVFGNFEVKKNVQRKKLIIKLMIKTPTLGHIFENRWKKKLILTFSFFYVYF